MSENSWDKDWLAFSRKSRRGIFVLLFIFVIVAVLPRIYRNHFMNSPLKVRISGLGIKKSQKDVIKLDTLTQSQKTTTNKRKQNTFSYNIPSEPFDPNTYTFKDWKKIGFSDKQVQTILNYQKSGGKFRIKEDLKKLYVVDEQLYSDLYDVIDLPDTILLTEKSNFPKKVKTLERISVNINTASEEELKEVYGIGSFFAKEIVKLRQGYGGIHNIKQLLDIYKMDEEKLSKIKESIVIESSDIIKININEATRKELSQNKLITWSVANSIVSMRESHGEFKKVDDLLKSVLIDQRKLEILKPYLRIE